MTENPRIPRAILSVEAAFPAEPIAMSADPKTPKLSGEGPGPRGPNKVGRPKKLISIETVEKMAAFGNSIEDIALINYCASSTLRQRMKDEPELREAFHRGRAQMRRDIRVRQVQIAKSDRADAGKLSIWLGKQELGQTDRRDVTSGGEPMGPAAVVNVPGNGREGASAEEPKAREGSDDGEGVEGDGE